MPVDIVGGGIAGLAAAIAFGQRKAAVTVHEKANAFSEVGAGLQISPNGMAVLDALGLGGAIRDIGLRVSAVELIDGLNGRRVASIPTDRHARPYMALHRADLIAVLADGAERVGADLQVSDAIAADDLTRLSGLVVGADGLHSVVRHELNGLDAPFFTGQVAWRAVIETGQKFESTVARVYMAPGQHVVTYDLRGGRMRNIVAVHEQQAWQDEGWAHSGSVDDMRARFAAMGPAVQRDLAQVEDVFVWGLFRHPVAPKWQDGHSRVLIGDAAHPTLPFLGQGANMALEDAWVLADCVSKHGFAAGMAAYQAKRENRVKRAIATANGNARNYHLHNRLLRWTAHRGLSMLSQIPGDVLSRRFDWLYQHDVTVLTVID